MACPISRSITRVTQLQSHTTAFASQPPRRSPPRPHPSAQPTETSSDSAPSAATASSATTRACVGALSALGRRPCRFPPCSTRTCSRLRAWAARAGLPGAGLAFPLRGSRCCCRTSRRPSRTLNAPKPRLGLAVRIDGVNLAHVFPAQRAMAEDAGFGDGWIKTPGELLRSLAQRFPASLVSSGVARESRTEYA